VFLALSTKDTFPVISFYCPDSFSLSSTNVIACGGQTFAQVSHPTQFSLSTTGFPLKFSNGTCGSFGNFDVYAGVTSEITASLSPVV